MLHWSRNQSIGKAGMKGEGGDGRRQVSVDSPAERCLPRLPISLGNHEKWGGGAALIILKSGPIAPVRTG